MNIFTNKKVKEIKALIQAMDEIHTKIFLLASRVEPMRVVAKGEDLDQTVDINFSATLEITRLTKKLRWVKHRLTELGVY